MSGVKRKPCQVFVVDLLVVFGEVSSVLKVERDFLPVYFAVLRCRQCRAGTPFLSRRGDYLVLAGLLGLIHGFICTLDTAALRVVTA